MFVYYAGHAAAVVNQYTGEINEARFFAAVLGAYNYNYTCAVAAWTLRLQDWISSHQRTFTFLNDVPEIVVPDNLRMGVSKAHRYETDINPTYPEFSAHYGIAITLARVCHPKDKAKDEGSVLFVELWILAALRNRIFFSLLELNQAIRKLLERLNTRAFMKLPGCRQEIFAVLNQPALRALPATPYTYTLWKKIRVHIDYHVEIKSHYYSVPYQLVKKHLDARITEHTVECFYKSKRVASHVRSLTADGRHTTAREHMPKSHQ